MDPCVEACVTSIHANRHQAVLYATGGGVQALSWLLSVPGATRSVLEASVPYAREALVRTLGGTDPPQFCSAATAEAMAVAAYRRAAVLSSFGVPLVGVGIACSLVTEPMKRGEHRAYVTAVGSFGTRTLSLTLAKGARNRVQEDDLVSRAVVRLLAEVTGEDAAALTLPLIEAAEGPSSSTSGLVDVLVDTSRPGEADPIDALLAGRASCVEFSPGGVVLVDAPREGKVVLPGSFHPLHEGHRQLLSTAVARVGGGAEGCFELSVGNADKGMLPADEVRRRVAQFTSAGLPLILTSEPLFTGKAALLRGSKFVLGWDTAVRIVMPKYYDDSETTMLLDLAGLRHAGCSFVVAGRKDRTDGTFKDLSVIDVPPRLADLFVGIGEEVFRLDLSSTELRSRAAAAADALAASS
ncbi:hypothetical protein FOA52_008979 [Chlamydomonas sp. UWO 241]|nr:hypothetical protein FOA52_008979 [Chlamydomonas sp. UWO 241]